MVFPWKGISVALTLMLAPLAVMAGNATIEVGHGSFEPEKVSIEAGESVVFRNAEMMPGGHTIVFEELDARSPGLDQGETWTHTFDEPGTYSFRVKEHPDEAGTVVVE